MHLITRVYDTYMYGGLTTTYTYFKNLYLDTWLSIFWEVFGTLLSRLGHAVEA